MHVLAEEQRALDLHNGSIVVDAAFRPKMEDEAFQRIVKGGATVVSLSVSVGSGLEGDDTFPKVVQKISRYYQWLDRNSDKALLIANTDDIEEVKKKKQCGILFATQNTTFLQDELELLTVSRRLGIRIIQLTYNYRNSIGDGCTERTNSGLSKLGIELVEQMNKQGIVIDLSHCGDQTTIEAIDISKDPVICSHANTRFLCDNPRNKSDEHVKALAEKGGVIGISAFSPLCKKLQRKRKPTIEDYLDHIDHLVELVGADHIGLGTDLDETNTRESWARFTSKYPEFAGYSFEEMYVSGLDITRLPEITKGLVARGYSDDEVEKILGGNFMRVFGSVWK